MSIENGNLHIVKVFNELTFETYFEPCIYSTRKLAKITADKINTYDDMKAKVINWMYKDK